MRSSREWVLGLAIAASVWAAGSFSMRADAQAPEAAPAAQAAADTSNNADADEPSAAADVGERRRPKPSEVPVREALRRRHDRRCAVAPIDRRAGRHDRAVREPPPLPARSKWPSAGRRAGASGWPYRGAGGAGEATERAGGSIAALLEQEGESRSEAIAAAGAAGRPLLRRHIQKAYPIAIIATLQPLLWLLGTVWGLIGAFDAVALAGQMGNPSIFAERSLWLL